MLAAIKKDITDNLGGEVKVCIYKDGKIELEAFADLNDSLNFSLHVGADSTEDNKIDVDIL